MTKLIRSSRRIAQQAAVSTEMSATKLCLGLLFLLLGTALVEPSAASLVLQNTSSPQVYSSSDWLNWAGTAWQYYQPGVGVNSATGLQRANLAWPCSTDWDFGGYIYAVIFARRLDLISDGSGSRDWQFNDRVNRLLDWLQTRPLNG